MHESYDTIVLGAGIAGLAAARVLAEAGRHVLILEARAQVGGRMRTHFAAGVDHPIELGAEFIHGRPPELLALLEEAGLAICEAEGEQYCFHEGKLGRCPEDGAMWQILEGMAAAERMGDLSFDDYLALSTANDAAKQRARGYIEGFNAADAREIGVKGLARQQAAEDAIEGHRAARVVRGYQALAEYVRDRAVTAGAYVLLEAVATCVEWQPGRCTVHAGLDRRWTAEQVICALPLGVLQAETIAFLPAPQAALAAAQSLRVGTVDRRVFQFREAFWAEKYPQLRFLFAQPNYPPTWWTTTPRISPLLVSWGGGPATLHHRDDNQVSLLHLLETIFDRSQNSLEAELIATHKLDWSAEPLTRGAYSYAPAGAGDASFLLAQPVENTLFFAGEHTDVTGHPGTVHGALRSGLRAAQQALAANVHS